MNKTNETILRIFVSCIAVFIGLKALETAILIVMSLIVYSDYGAHSAAQLLTH